MNAGNLLGVFHFFRVRHFCELGPEVFQDGTEGAHRPIVFFDGNAHFFKRFRRVLWHFYKLRQRIPKRRARLLPFDSRIRHEACRQCHVLDAVLQCPGEWRNVFERFAHHADIGIGV